MTAHERISPTPKTKDETCSFCGKFRDTVETRTAKCGACAGNYRGKLCEECAVAFEAQDYCANIEEEKHVHIFIGPVPAQSPAAAILN